jgi:ABC-type branched-subunit amino acid transport system permease subunit
VTAPAPRHGGPRPRPRPGTHRRRRAAAFGGALALLLLVVLAPDPVVLGAMRLAAFATATTGAVLVIGRTRAADLALAAAVAAGAYLGGVGSALLELPVLAGLPVGAVAGAAVGATSGALHGRIGRLLGALTSLALGTGVVAVLAAWPAAGGVAGFHAVGLPSPWGDRVDLAVVGVLLLVATAIQVRMVDTRAVAAGAVAIDAPEVSSALGRHPVRDAAVTGTVGGALLGLGGATLAAVDGSVLPGAYGLELTAALALAALLGGTSPVGAVVGAVFVWGPGTVWPLVPLVGTAPPLLVAGPVGLAVLALRRGRPLVPSTLWAGGGVPAGDGDRAGDGDPIGPARPRPPRRRLALVARRLATPGGEIDLRLEPGEVVALVGPNGAGKSTAVARLGGQLPDHGAVELGGRAAPRGAAARARLGILRTWQRPPEVAASDVERVVLDEEPGRRAARWATDTLDVVSTGRAAPLVWLAARGPAVALLDEPTDVPVDRLVPFLRGLADAGTAVLVVDHRPEIAAAADRVLTLGLPEVVP